MTTALTTTVAVWNDAIEAAIRQIDPNTLSNVIRHADGNHTMGAGALAEIIADTLIEQVAGLQVPDTATEAPTVLWDSLTRTYHEFPYVGHTPDADARECGECRQIAGLLSNR